MVTTIQVNSHTLELLKKLKQELEVPSYDEAIKKIILKRSSGKSLAGFLGKKPREKILEKLRDKSDRF